VKSTFAVPKPLIYIFTALIVLAGLGELFLRYERWTYSTRKAQTKEIAVQLASDIERIKVKLGRAPTNEIELETLLRHPIPRSAWNYRFSYTNDGTNFHFWTMSPWPMIDVFDYNSGSTNTPLSIYRF
jgi:hypothetical protein